MMKKSQHRFSGIFFVAPDKTIPAVVRHVFSPTFLNLVTSQLIQCLECQSVVLLAENLVNCCLTISGEIWGKRLHAMIIKVKGSQYPDCRPRQMPQMFQSRAVKHPLNRLLALYSKVEGHLVQFWGSSPLPHQYSCSFIPAGMA